MHYLTLLSALVVPSAAAQDNPVCEPPSVCIPGSEMSLIVRLLEDKKCQLDEAPEFKLDPIQVITDRQGRVFFSGADPKPYTLTMTWCNYEIEAKGKVNLIAAKREPPIWGFRLRPKAYMGLVPSDAFYGSDDPRRFRDFVDAGVMVDFLHYDWANLNAAVGYRSVGGGVGFDITENFGVYSGYALTWVDWHHNVNLSLWFSFWNPS